MPSFAGVSWLDDPVDTYGDRPMHIKLHVTKAGEIWVTESGAYWNLGIGIGGLVGQLDRVVGVK